MGLYLEEACKLKWWKGGTERKNRNLMAKHLISQRGSTLVCPRPSRLTPRSTLCRDLSSDHEYSGLGLLTEVI
jgi:hypothetical protein